MASKKVSFPFSFFHGGKEGGKGTVTFRKEESEYIKRKGRHTSFFFG